MAGIPVTFTGIMWRSDLEVGGGPMPPGPGGSPPGIWGGGNEPFPRPPIYIPVPPPPESGLSPEHPIYIPIYPAHPIVIPLPPEGGKPQPPVVWPPLPTHPIAPGGPPPGLWPPGSGIDLPAHPIYIPLPPSEAHPEHPIYLPVYPAHPIVLPPDGTKPEPPPGMVQPPSGARGFWGYSVYYDSMVFVPYEGTGAPGQPVVNPLGEGRSPS